MSDTLLEVNNLTKAYGNFTAINGISFVIPAGKVIGFLGPNGAGKTTTIQMLCGITTPTSGKINYFGKDFFTHREACLSRINFASAFNTLMGRIKVNENLLVFAMLYNVKHAQKKIDELAEYFEVTSLLKNTYWDLSAGQKTRINILKSLLNDPELILMDEPTASLDPDIADKTIALIEDLRTNKNISILYTSHDMEEVTRVCDEVIFLDRGNIIAHDTPLGLTKRIPTAKLHLMFDAKREIVANYLEENKYQHAFVKKNAVEITTEEKHIPKIIFALSNADVWITDIEVKKPTLEDFFLQIARGGTHETT